MRGVPKRGDDGVIQAIIGVSVPVDRRGFTHRSVVGSHTLLSWDHTPNHVGSHTGPSLKAAEILTFSAYFPGLTFLTIPI